jgi:hypothetical protein
VRQRRSGGRASATATGRTAAQESDIGSCTAARHRQNLVLMAVAAGSALLRSVATKMRGMTICPRASPLRHPLLLGGRRPGPTSSRQPFSSSSSAPSGSTPPPINDMVRALLLTILYYASVTVRHTLRDRG